MFKLIAIETLKRHENLYHISEGMTEYQRRAVDLRRARYDSVMKVLKPNHVFWFYKGYGIKEDGEYERMACTEDNFFSYGHTNVSICSIVAENGMGKSSLLELYFRIINNVSFALRDGLPVQKAHLCFVRDIYAKVVYEVDNKFYIVEQRDGIITFYDQSEAENNWQYDYDNNNEQELGEHVAKERLKKFFYSIVVNYSQYSYNTNDYISEWDDHNQDGVESNDNQCWISSLFHKNDAYQTPIVLNPFREEGNININKEKDLTHKRLFQLVMTNPDMLNRVLRNKRARCFVFDVEDDLNPVHGHRYSSRRVIRMMAQMNIIESMRKSIGSKTVNDVGKRITAAWGHALGYYIEPKQSDEYWRDMDVVRTINYIVYKTLKITTIYSKYSRHKECFGDKKSVQEYVNELNEDNSHITLKIRKCLAYVNFKHYSSGHLDNGRIVGNEIGFQDFAGIIDACMERTDAVFGELIRTQYTTLDKGDEARPHYWLLDDLLPAPSFRADIMLEDENHHPVRFSSLSSGEKQMIYSMCTVMYQLSNVSSVWDNGDADAIKYRNVNLVFDEIELYAHPKYQLMLVDMLLSSINSLNLMGVLNVNIMIATHSPFILSDIPSANILKLQEGKPAEEDNPREVFGANVYDILCNGFFLKQYIGTFATERIERLSKKVIEAKKAEVEDKERLKSELSIIGDDLIRNMLLDHLCSYD